MDPQIMAQLQQGAGQPPQPMPPQAPQGQQLPKDQSMIIVEALIKQLERLDAQKRVEMGEPPKGMEPQVPQGPMGGM
jgi:hypothetical protein